MGAFGNTELLQQTQIFIDFRQVDAEQFSFAQRNDDWVALGDFIALRAIAHLAGEHVRPSVQVLASSFPRTLSVPVEDEVNSNGFAHGSRRIVERELYNEVKSRYGNSLDVSYGDYAGVNLNPSGGGRGWIPRVDLPAGDSFDFYRQRTRSNWNKSLELGGLMLYNLPENNSIALKIIAKHIVENFAIDQISNDFVRQEILRAAQEQPRRADPSFWKAIRMAEHMTVQNEKMRRDA